MHQPFVKSIHHVQHSPVSKLISLTSEDKPYITIDDGDEVTFDNTNSDFGVLKQDTTDAELEALDLKEFGDIVKLWGPIYVNGPVFVKGTFSLQIQSQAPVQRGFHTVTSKTQNELMQNQHG